MPIDPVKLDAIAKEIADCHMCRPHEMHVREILEKHLGEPNPEPMPSCVDCGVPIKTMQFDSGYMTRCGGQIGHTYGPRRDTESDAIAAYRKLAGNRLTLPLPVNGTACPVMNVSGTAIRAVVFGMADAAEFAHIRDGRRVLSPIEISVTVAGENNG